MKATVSIAKKVGQPNYGSLCASCTLEVDLPESSPGAVAAELRHAYALAVAAVEEQLRALAEPAAGTVPAYASSPQDLPRARPLRDDEIPAAAHAHAAAYYGGRPATNGYHAPDHAYHAPAAIGTNNGAPSPVSTPEPKPEPAPPRGNGNGKKFDGPPTTGKALWAWVKDQEQRYNLALGKYLGSWAKLQDFDGRMVDWSPDQVAAGHAEALRKLSSLPGDSRE